MFNAISNTLVWYISTVYLGFPPAWNLALVQKTWLYRNHPRNFLFDWAKTTEIFQKICSDIKLILIFDIPAHSAKLVSSMSIIVQQDATFLWTITDIDSRCADRWT